LDELFSSIDKSKEQLEQSINKLIIYKNTFFNSLLESKRKSIKFEKRRFEDCVVNYSNKRIPLSSEIRKERKGSYRYYGATGVIDFIDDYIFDGKYLLLGEDGANLLSKSKDLSFIVEGQFWVNNHAHIVKSNEDILLEYLQFYFNSLNISEFVTGTAQPKLNRSNLNRIEISIPPLDEQVLIVQETQRVYSIIEETLNVINNSLSEISLFKETILNKAFIGELVDNDPSDMSVQNLFESIKAEKEEFLVREKDIRKNSTIVKVMNEQPKSILEILIEKNEPISTKELWLSSNKKDDIEAFYAELKDYIESGQIVELPREGRESKLKIAEQS